MICPLDRDPEEARKILDPVLRYRDKDAEVFLSVEPHEHAVAGISVLFHVAPARRTRDRGELRGGSVTFRCQRVRDPTWS